MLTRRRLLVPLAALTVTSAFSGTVAARRRVMLPGRPATAGTSATRCAQCGAPDHTMLERRCPAAPRVL